MVEIKTIRSKAELREVLDVPGLKMTKSFPFGPTGFEAIVTWLNCHDVKQCWRVSVKSLIEWFDLHVGDRFYDAPLRWHYLYVE